MLLAWAFRTHLAKTYDPSRSRKERLESFRQLMNYFSIVSLFVYPEPNAEDKKIYNQRWEALPEFEKIIGEHVKK